MASDDWEHFYHVADIGIRGFGHSKEAAFAQAALALTGVLTDPKSVQAKEKVEICCNAPDDEILLVDWLDSLLFEMATRKMIFGRFEVKLQSGNLYAVAWGEAVDISRHQPAVEIKGATFTELRVSRTDDGWVAQCVVDV